jgi:hypothetical protein
LSFKEGKNKPLRPHADDQKIEPHIGLVGGGLQVGAPQIHPPVAEKQHIEIM